MHFLKKRTLHCALYSLLHFSKHELPWTLNLNTLSLSILWCKYNDIVNKIFVGMFACSRLKLIIIFCSYLKPKRDYIWICKSAISLMYPWVSLQSQGIEQNGWTCWRMKPSVVVNLSEVSIGRTRQQNIIISPLILFIWEDLYYLMNYRVYITPQTKNWNMDLNSLHLPRQIE